MEEKKGGVDDKILLGSRLGELQMNSFDVQNLELMEVYPKQSFNFFQLMEEWSGRVESVSIISFGVKRLL